MPLSITRLAVLAMLFAGVGHAEPFPDDVPDEDVTTRSGRRAR